MLLKLDEPKLLSDVIGIISELVTEVKLKADKNGISIVAIDPANVALTAFKLPSSSFSQFEAEEETIGISLDSLKSVLKRAGVGSSLVLQTEDNLLNVEIHDKIKRMFKLALIDIDSEDKSVPNLEFTSRVEMPSVDFGDAVEDSAVVADSCSFITQNGKFIIEARGLNSSKNEFSSDEVKIEAENAKAKYSLEYLQKFAKASKLADKVVINFSEDYPLKLEFKSGDLELLFVLAPRVETED